MKKDIKEKFDFKPLGNAIKLNRKSKDWTQEYIAELLDLQLPYYSRIENNGQHPSLQILYELIQLLHISVDEFLLPDKEENITSKRLAIENLLSQLSDSDLTIVEGTIKGILESKAKQNERENQYVEG